MERPVLTESKKQRKKIIEIKFKIWNRHIVRNSHVGRHNSIYEKLAFIQSFMHSFIRAFIFAFFHAEKSFPWNMSNNLSTNILQTFFFSFFRHKCSLKFCSVMIARKLNSKLNCSLKNILYTFLHLKKMYIFFLRMFRNFYWKMR